MKHPQLIFSSANFYHSCPVLRCSILTLILSKMCFFWIIIRILWFRKIEVFFHIVLQDLVLSIRASMAEYLNRCYSNLNTNSIIQVKLIQNISLSVPVAAIFQRRFCVVFYAAQLLFLSCYLTCHPYPWMGILLPVHSNCFNLASQLKSVCFWETCKTSANQSQWMYWEWSSFL